MSSDQPSRRSFLAFTGAAAVLAALPVGARTAYADSLQANLDRLVQLRFGMFNHFSLGTFTNEEWAQPNQSPTLFAPSSVDCVQWAAAAAAAKMSYGILTTKHHDGFCLWPTTYNRQNVAYSGYHEDVVAKYVTAFRDRGLKVGFYYSVWDRTHGVQAYDTRHGVGTDEAIQPADIRYTLGQIKELLTNYGKIDIFMTDGYAWQMGQQAVPYQQVRDLVKSLQPDIVMLDIGGLSEPWLGDAIFFEEPLGVSAPAGNTYAGMQGQTIGKGWFWHPSTPTEGLMSRTDILNHLADLGPRYTSFILNCPPNRNGRLDTNIVNRLAEVGAAWNPNTPRPPLPVQQARCEFPITPVNAYGTGAHTGEGPLNAIDGLSDARFETCWSTWNLPLPQTITVDLGAVWNNVSPLEYLPKQWNRKNSTDGDITSATISTSTDGVTFTTVATANWAGDRKTKIVEWPARAVRLIQVRVTAATGGYANISGLAVGGRAVRPSVVSRFPAENTAYRLQARHSGKVVDVYQAGTANGTDVMQRPWLDKANQKWTFTSTGDGYFKIRDVNSGKLLEVAGLSRVDGGNVAIWSDVDVPQQHWAVTPVGDGYHVLTNRLSGRSLNVSGGSTADGANVDQREYVSAPEEQWQIIPV